MPASLLELKKRIASVKQTSKITEATVSYTHLTLPTKA